MTPKERAARAQARREQAARIEAGRAVVRAAVAANTCPTCGRGLRRNLSLTGWWQCEQLGAEQFRADPTKAPCPWQGFTGVAPAPTGKESMMATKSKTTHHHRHRPAKGKTIERCYGGPVAERENPAAHGNIVVIDECRCGAHRATNVNGRHIERSEWSEVPR